MHGGLEAHRAPGPRAPALQERAPARRARWPAPGGRHWAPWRCFRFFAFSFFRRFLSALSPFVIFFFFFFGSSRGCAVVARRCFKGRGSAYALNRFLVGSYGPILISISRVESVARSPVRRKVHD